MAYCRLKDGDRLKWGGDAASRLAESVINVTSAGGLNPLHVHPRNLWAVVLYLDMGDETKLDVRGEWVTYILFVAFSKMPYGHSFFGLPHLLQKITKVRISYSGILSSLYLKNQC